LTIHRTSDLLRVDVVAGASQPLFGVVGARPGAIFVSGLSRIAAAIDFFAGGQCAAGKRATLQARKCFGTADFT
jgi:hypothetical protein